MDIRPLGLACLCLLAGCAVGPDYHRPQSAAPRAWPALSGAARPAGTASAVSTVTQQPFDGHRWWGVFHDAVLDGLIDDAARQNLNLQIAASRIAQARAQQAAAASALLPSASLNAGGLRSRFSENGLGASSGGSGGSGGGAAGQQQESGPSNTFQYGFDAMWELDLWGKTRRSIEAADANTEAAIEDRHDALVSLTAEIARAYFALRGAQAELRITREDLDTQRHILALTRSRSKVGFASEADVLQVQSRIAASEATVPQLEESVEQGYNRLALLLSLPPGALRARLQQPTPLPALPPQVPAGLPGALLRRRPDIRRSEAQLHAATAQVGVAVAQLFPSVRLGVTGGMQASHLSDLHDWASRFFLLGSMISVPVFEGGQLKANIRIAKAKNEQALLQYRQAVLSAYHDVDDAMIAYAKEQQRAASLRQQVDYARTALHLRQAQYAQGLAAFLDVLQAQQDLQQAQLQLAQSTVTTTTDLVALFKALGGDWSFA